MPDAKGLFHRAASHSGAAMKVNERDAATALAERLLAELGIAKNDVRKIQEVPIERLMGAYASVPGAWGPVLDADVIPKHLFSPVASDVNPDVPLILGANRTEMTYFSSADDYEIDEGEMRKRVADLLGSENAGRVIEVYREANPDAPPFEIYFLVYSDQRYVMRSISIAERRAELGGGPVHLYYLTWEVNDQRMSPHALDIPFAFDNVRTNRFTREAESAVALADKVSDAWIQFARTGNPDTGKLPAWTTFDATTRSTMVLDNTSEVISDPLRTRREVMGPILNL